ncbi:MAG TPA: hypothetical protein VFR33_07545 [Candidatus Dormibacteraeota bacterium]|nr:hypothetical protein [Candidatus Dormibacteraeota bacterium]
MISIAIGVVLLVLGFVIPGSTRDLIFRVLGVLAILAGVATWVMRRR